MKCVGWCDNPKCIGFENRLLRQVDELRDIVRDVVIRPLPPDDSPGYEIWSALMEDLREEGVVRLEVRDQLYITIEVYPTEEAA